MIARLAAGLQRHAGRVAPDPFVLALVLTGVVLATAAGRLAVDPGACATLEAGCAPLGWRLWSAWFGGFSGAAGLAFALQMALVLISGQALASSPPVARAIDAVAGKVRGPRSAAVIVSLVACSAALVNWGLGAVAGALVARRVRDVAAGRGIAVNYPVLGAAAYAGMAVWHGGLSGSAPLKVAEEGHFLADTLGVLPLGQTLGSPLNLAVTGSLVVLFAWLAAAMATGPGAEVPSEAPSSVGGDGGGARGVWPGRCVGLGLLGVIALAVVSGRSRVDINLVNAVFVAAGIAAHGSLARYADAVSDAARGAGAIVLQFPFYFGIVGLMVESGLVTWVSQMVASFATTETYGAIAFLLAAAVNFVVPSGGGQWAVQGPILAEAGAALGVSPAVTVMAFAYGDACTNLVQPFWALALLGVMGLRARDIIGYCAVMCGAMLVLVSVWLLVLT